MSDSEEEARLYLQVGSQEIDLKGTMREVNDEWIRLKDQDTWASALSKIRIARQEAIDASIEAMTKQGIPESGSAFNRLIGNCGIHKTADIILAAVHFLRSVEKQIERHRLLDVSSDDAVDGFSGTGHWDHMTGVGKDSCKSDMRLVILVAQDDEFIGKDIELLQIGSG